PDIYTLSLHDALPILILTGTLLGGYADDAFNILYRVEPKRMREEGFDHGEAGMRQFASVYGVLEKVTTIEAADNACSKAKVTTTDRKSTRLNSSHVAI